MLGLKVLGARMVMETFLLNLDIVHIKNAY